MPTYCEPWPGKTKAIRSVATFTPLLRPAHRFGFLAQRLDFRFEPLPKLSRQTFFFCAVLRPAQHLRDVTIHFLVNRFARRANGIFDCSWIGPAMGDDRHSI